MMQFMPSGVRRTSSQLGSSLPDGWLWYTARIRSPNSSMHWICSSGCISKWLSLSATLLMHRTASLSSTNPHISRSGLCLAIEMSDPVTRSASGVAAS
jgi:hypothetical protein